MANTQQFLKIDSEIHRAREAFRANPESKELKCNLDELVKVREAMLDEMEKPFRERSEGEEG
jgi:hypothetical protein